MSDFINSELGHRSVSKIEKNPISKNKCDLSSLENKSWKVSSLSRGKEMMLVLSSGEETKHLKIGFARIGTVETYSLEETNSEEFSKRAMLRFYTADKVYAISDFTRYVIWRWSDQWDTRRSPDPYSEHNDWRDHLYKHRKSPYFQRPIFDLMCDQRFFNGVGTISRSEILSRTRFSPFTNFDEVLRTEILRNDFFQVTKETLESIYDFGGLQFQHWKNPFGVSKFKINRWIRCFNKPRKAYFLKDTDGRKFWFDKRWSADYVEWVNSNEVQDTRLLKKIYSKTKK